MECLKTLATEAISKTLEDAVNSILEQFKYMIHHKKIIANLKEEHEKLNAIKEALQGRVDADRRSGLEISPVVKKWLSDVEGIEQKLSRSEDKQKKCFSEKCPNLALNYSLGKQAAKSTEEITRLKEEEKNLRKISYPKAPPRLGSTFVEDIKSIGSRNKIIADVIDKLKDDKLKRISICGMGGVGKTTLAKEVIMVVENEKLFATVAMAAVSQNPNYMSIQSQIADRFCFNFRRVSMEGRAGELLQMLNENDHKVLIVLDDVWNMLDFEKIGLPSRDLQKGIKILFTSRYEEECRKMGSQENIPVSVLSKHEAWYLFREMAGHDVVAKNDIHPIAKQVADECGGLPLAIVTIARALENNDKKSEWEVVLEKLRNSQQSPLSDMEFVYSRIEISLDKLSDEHKSFLFLCSLFPEDFDVPVECVLRYGVGLGLFKATGNQVWKARNQVNYLVSNLRRCFLLMDSNRSGCVKMHDVVRDSVLKSRAQDGIFVDDNNAQDGILVENKWRKMSLFLNEAIDVLENGLECPTLELLQVWSMREKKTIPWPKNIIQGTSNKLKVLALRNWCIPKLTSLSQASSNLHTLQVEHCDVGDISIIGKEFMKLEILSFAYSSIKEIPSEIGELNCLRLLDLTGCDDLEFICDNVLAKLSCLQELYFRIKNFPWMLNKDIFMELKNLSKQLRALEFSIRKVEILPKDLNFENLEKFCVYVLPHYDHPSHFESNKLHLTSTSHNSLKSSSMIIHLVGKCEILILEKVKDLKSIDELVDDNGLYDLKDLRVDSCTSLQYVMDCNTSCDAFPLIKSMSLAKLPKLTEIFNAASLKSSIKFSYLEILELTDLPNFIGFSSTIESHQQVHHGLSSTTALADSINVEDGKTLSRSTNSEPGGHKFSSIGAKLFSCRWMEQFPNMKSILLKKCSSLEMLFDLQGYSQSFGHPLSLLFPQLEEIEISYLDNLTHVWGNVPNSVQGFQNLRSLTISGCDSLKCVFTPNIIGAITNLEKLKIKSCKMMRNLGDWDNDDEDDRNKSKGQVKKNVVFGKLYYVSLSELPELENVCEGSSHQLEWPSLREIEIVNCPKLDISLLSTTNIQEKKDSLDETYDAVKEDSNFHNVKENNLGCFHWIVGRKSLLPKLIRQQSNNKDSNEEGSLTQDSGASTFVTNSNTEKDKKLILENDITRVRCNLKAKSIITINSFSKLESLRLTSLPNLARFCISGTNKFSKTQDMVGTATCDEGGIRRDPLIDGSQLFSNLTSLTVESCNKISILFSSLGILERLRTLQVLNCENIEEIVLVSQVQETEPNDKNKKIKFPELQDLYLGGLPNLRAFCQGSYDFDFPSLLKVRIVECPNMEIFSGGPSHTPKLQDVDITTTAGINSNYVRKNKDLNSTIQGFQEFLMLRRGAGTNELRRPDFHEKYLFGYLFTSHYNYPSRPVRPRNSRHCLITSVSRWPGRTMVIRNFHKISTFIPFNEIHMPQLQRVRQLSIEECDSLVQVFELESAAAREIGGGDHHAIPTIHSNYDLEMMVLYNLPKLRHIWKYNTNYMTAGQQLVSFQKLTSLRINECHSLKSLLSYSMATSLVHLQLLDVWNCNMMEEIVTKQLDKNDYIISEGAGSKVKTLFPKLERMDLSRLPELKCVCSGDYDYDVPLGGELEDMNTNNNNKIIQISFPQLKVLTLHDVPKLKCFCSGAYDYHIILLSNQENNIQQQEEITTSFPRSKILCVSTPNLHYVSWNYKSMRTLGDINLTMHYIQNSEKYKVELQNLETLKGIIELQRDDNELGLVGYIKREYHLVLENCDRLLNYCIPSQLFSHLRSLTVRECGCIQEIFESTTTNNDHYELGAYCTYDHLYSIELHSLPKLKHIWKNPDQVIGCFNRLQTLDIYECHVSSSSSAKSLLPNLHYLYVRECNMMEQIIQLRVSKIIFPNLRGIELKKLPNLICFCQTPCYLELPQCWYISIQECHKMETFYYQENVFTPSLYK